MTATEELLACFATGNLFCGDDDGSWLMEAPCFEF